MYEQKLVITVNSRLHHNLLLESFFVISRNKDVSMRYVCYTVRESLPLTTEGTPRDVIWMPNLSIKRTIDKYRTAVPL
jgi:hypothetical protein